MFQPHVSGDIQFIFGTQPASIHKQITIHVHKWQSQQRDRDAGIFEFEFKLFFNLFSSYNIHIVSH